MIKLSPSILSADFTRLGEEARAVAAAGADYLHVDIMDGHFVPNLTFGPVVVAALARATSLPLDVHLMISPVEPYIADYVKAGAHILTVHAEATHHLDRALAMVRELGARPGVSLNPATPVCMVENVLHLVDLVLVMSVNPGFGGQQFIPQSLEKVRTLRRMIDASGRTIELQVDGGIKPDNIALVTQAGADCFVAGSAVFSQPDYAAVMRQLRDNAR